MKHQFVWSPQYIDQSILCDTYSGGAQQVPRRLFYLADANYNLTGVMKRLDSSIVPDRPRPSGSRAGKASVRNTKGDVR